MRLTDGIFTRTESGRSSWGNGMLKSLAIPALPPSRRERANRAAVFASRLLASDAQPVLLPGLNRGKA